MRYPPDRYHLRSVAVFNRGAPPPLRRATRPKGVAATRWSPAPPQCGALCERDTELPNPVSANPDQEELVGGDPSVELSSNRTALSFERTRMAADRTLMATVRTSLSLISFGFTINEVFLQWHEQNDERVGGAASYFGLGLVLLGILVLGMGVIGHRRIMRLLAERRERLFRIGVMRHAEEYEPTATFMAAVVLLVLGAAAAVSIILRSIL